MRFHPRKIICLGRFLITSIVFVAFLSLFNLLTSRIYFGHLFLHIYIFYRFSAFVTFLPVLLLQYIYANSYILLALENNLGEVETS